MLFPRACISASTTSMPFLSIVRNAALDRRKLIQRRSLSTQNRRHCRLGRKRLFVLLLAWETWWPVIGFFPVTSHTRAMAIHSKIQKRILYPEFRYFLKSNQSPLRKGHRRPVTDDKMIQDFHVHQRKCVF